jgi:hypothetical protein
MPRRKLTTDQVNDLETLNMSAGQWDNRGSSTFKLPSLPVIEHGIHPHPSHNAIQL